MVAWGAWPRPVRVCHLSLRSRPVGHRLSGTSRTGPGLFNRTLAAVASYNDERSWLELLMLLQTMWASATAAFTLERIQRWVSTPRYATPAPNLANGSGLDSVTRRSRTLGFDKKACAALLSQGLCAQTADTVAALQALQRLALGPLALRWLICRSPLPLRWSQWLAPFAPFRLRLLVFSTSVNALVLGLA